MKVLVTGAGSRLGEAVLPALAAHARVTAILAADTRPPRFGHAKVAVMTADIGAAALDGALAGCDALVHLGFGASDGAAPDALFDRNVRGVHKLFHAARNAGVKRLVYISTAAVYGGAVHANEQAPLKPTAGFTFAEHHARLEQLLEIDLPDCVRLRPHIVLGPHAHALAKVVLKQPFHVRLGEPEPLFQCVHEADVAQAIVLSLEKEARGAYNLAVDENFTLREAIRARHRFALPLPRFATGTALRLAARAARCDLDGGCMDQLSRTLLVNCRRAMIDLGWRSRYTLREVLRDT